MIERRCEQVRERIPDLVAGRLDAREADALDGHLRRCAECREERGLVELLHGARPPVPAELAERIHAGLGLTATGEDDRAEGTTRRRGGASLAPWWGLAAAVVAAVALWVGVEGGGPGAAGVGDAPVPAWVAEEGGGSVWLSGDGEVAGAPVLDDLDDRQLLLFLEELEAGGAA